MKKLIKKKSISDNSFELLDDDASLLIDGGVNSLFFRKDDKNNDKNTWEKASELLDNLV
jgi:hypothetical protein